MELVLYRMTYEEQYQVARDLREWIPSIDAFKIIANTSSATLLVDRWQTIEQVR